VKRFNGMLDAWILIVVISSYLTNSRFICFSELLGLSSSWNWERSDCRSASGFWWLWHRSLIDLDIGDSCNVDKWEFVVTGLDIVDEHSLSRLENLNLRNVLVFLPYDRLSDSFFYDRLLFIDRFKLVMLLSERLGSSRLLLPKSQWLPRDFEACSKNLQINQQERMASKW
jgi:hypothetical protein